MHMFFNWFHRAFSDNQKEESLQDDANQAQPVANKFHCDDAQADRSSKPGSSDRSLSVSDIENKEETDVSADIFPCNADDHPCNTDAEITGRNPSGWQSKSPLVIGKPGPSIISSVIGRDFHSTPYRPDTVLDGWSTEYLTVRAASVRGSQHRYQGTPRQDDLSVLYRHEDSLLAVSVADGVSAATQSHIGASTAVRYSTQWVIGRTDGFENQQVFWSELFQNTAWAVVERSSHLLGQDHTDALEAERLLCTTLVTAVIRAASYDELTVTVGAIGDSTAWVLRQDGYEIICGGKYSRKDGLSNSAVTGLPRIPDDPQVATRTIHRDEVLLIGTDGFGDPLGSGKGDVGKHFASALLQGPPPLIEFFHLLDFSRDTFDDDRTLVAVWPGRW